MSHGLDAVEKRKIWHCRESNPGCATHSPPNIKKEKKINEIYSFVKNEDATPSDELLMV
jgi:hypothetical protein